MTTQTITLEEAQAHLAELVGRLAPGEELVITAHDQPAARLVGLAGASPRAPRPAPGLGKGSILYMAPDFDETPEEFREYLD
jgi:prevent-host-death family protein